MNKILKIISANQWHALHSRRFALATSLLSFIAISIYVLGFNAYDSDKYLYSDMLGFWQRAISRIFNNEYETIQYLSWPPFYHFFIAEIIRMLEWLDLKSMEGVRTFLLINIFAFSFSVYCLHRIAVMWHLPGPHTALVTFLYAFGFPAFYFNAFLLSGNLSTPLLVISIAIFCHKSHWRNIILSAIVFGIATIIRPAIGPFGLAFVLYLLIQKKFSKQFILYAGLFTLAFFSIVLLAGAEVMRISHGKTASISPNGGLDFFIAMSDFHRINLHYNGWHQEIIVPGHSFEPEKGTWQTKVPFYDQAHYYSLGWEFIKHNPAKLFNNKRYIKNLFFGDMLPTRPEAPGYRFFRPIWDAFKFFMMLSFGLFYFYYKKLSDHEKPLVCFLLSSIFILLVLSYFFTGEPRYSYSIIFVFYLLFFKLLQHTSNDIKFRRHAIERYLGTLFFSISIIVAMSFITKTEYPSTVKIETTDIEPAMQYETGRVYFPFNENGELIQNDTKEKISSSNSTITVKTKMHLSGNRAIKIKFNIYTAWETEFFVDGASRLTTDPIDNYFRENFTRITLEPGWYELTYRFNYNRKPGGFSATYSYLNDENWQEYRFIGAQSSLISFSTAEITSIDN